jgi:protocatechuate 3,4-dioxygenase beta subunit
MVSSIRQAIACILLVFGATIFIQSQTVPAKGPTATISGKVTLKGKGLPGIVVALRSIESNQRVKAYKALTDEEGNYRLTNVAPGNYQVATVAPAFIVGEEQGRGQTLIITKDETIENIDFTLIRGGVITGKVTDSDGRPVVEEAVELYPVQGNAVQMNLRNSMELETRTDDRGIYRIYGLRPGNYRVAAGQSLRASGRQGMSYKKAFYPAASEISQAGIIEVTEGSETTNIDITLGRVLLKYSARGRIVDGETGRPLANVPYGLRTFIDENSTSSGSTGAVSNNEGEFHFDNLSPGKYAVLVERRTDNDLLAELVRFEVIDRDVTGLTVKTSKGGSVSGVIVLEGTDDKAAHVAVKKMQLQAFVRKENSMEHDGQSTTVNQDGSFHIGGLPAGLVNFSLFTQSPFRIVQVEREGIPYPKGIEIKEREQIAGVRITVNYANGTIRGVVKVENGTLPQNAVLYVSFQRLDESASSSNSSYYEGVQADARGQFFKEGLVPGMYEVTIASVYMRDGHVMPPQAKQQVVVVNGVVTDVTLTINLDSTPRRP